MLMDSVNITVLIIIFGLGGWLNRDDLKQAWGRFKERVKSVRHWIRRKMRPWADKKFLALIIFIFIVFLIGFVILFFWRLYPFIDKLYMAINAQIMGIDIGTDAFRNVSLAVAGSITLLIALLGVILTIIRNILTRQQNKTDEERLVAEQTSRAIEQMGAHQTANGKILEPNIEVRLGGLYSLQRIMQDSPRDEIPIARTFSAYVRENANKNKVKKKKDQPREDVQTALEIINQFNKVRRKQGRREMRTNLSRVDFTKYSFAHINFSGFILRDVIFSGEELFNTNFSKAYLKNANLSGARLFKVNLSGATLYYANLSKATLHDVDLSNRRLLGVDLSGATLLNVNLSEANLQDTNLESAILSTVKNLTQEQVDKAKGNEKTKLPDGLNRPKHWIKKKKPATKKTKKE